jgi:hypothetical protein
MYVGYLSYLTLFVLSIFAGAEKPSLRREKLVPLQRCVLEKVQYDLSYISVQWPCPSYLMCDHSPHTTFHLAVGRVARAPHPAPRRLLQ